MICNIKNLQFETAAGFFIWKRYMDNERFK